MWHEQTFDAVAKQLSTDTSLGLTAQEARARLEQSGLNLLPHTRKKRWWQLYLGQYKNPLVGILLVAAIFTFWLREWADTTVILIVVLVNSAIGFWQEFKSSNILEKLQKLITVKAQVIRDGRPHEIEAEQLAVGDLILLKAGMKVPADVRIAVAHDFETNEALLTGESTPVRKNPEPLHGELPLGDRSNMAFMGSAVESGDAQAIVVATGSHTEIGKIATLTQQTADDRTPLQEKLSRLGKIISIFVAIAGIIIFVVGLIEHRSFIEVFTTSVAVAVAAIPEGLPAALSVILAVAGQRILRSKGLIKHLTAAETLGSTSVICADKTGTLTEGVMKVEKVINYGNLGIILKAAAFANEALVETDIDTDAPVIRGEPTDRAKMEFFLESGGTLEETLLNEPRVGILPFNSAKKYLASFHQTGTNTALYVTGAPEALLARSARIERKAGPLNITDTDKAAVRRTYEEMAHQGFRMIAIAYRNIPQRSSLMKLDSQQQLHQFVAELSFCGLLAIRDPIREDVKESIKEARSAGLKVVMITGDHRLTAAAIGKELGFSTDAGAVIEAQDLNELSDDEFEKRVANIEIYARVNPEHKMRIVDAWKKRGEVVAMTGDGINDAPALKKADIGIAVGSGTDVTKEAADLVLLDDSFSLIPEAIREGRVAFDNIRKVTLLLLVGAFTELMLVMSSLIFKIPLPITAVQILWANLVEDGLPTFSLAFEPAEKDVMKRKPIKRTENILDKETLTMVFVIGIFTDLILVGLFLALYETASLSIEHIRTIIFAALSTDSLFYIFSFKSLRNSIFRTNIFSNKYLLAASVLGLALVVAVIYVPFLNSFMETVPLPPSDILLILSLALVKVALLEVTKWFFRRRAVLQEAT